VEFAGRISWEQLMERELGWHDALRAANHPAYGLGGNWTGPRMLGDVHFVGDDIESVGLAHGDPTDRATPLIHLHTTLLDPARADELVARRSELFPPGTSRTPATAPPFDPLSHEPVFEGQPLPAHGITAASGWVVRVAPEPGVTVYIEGHNIELSRFVHEHTSVRIADLTPYLEGRLTMLRDAWR
jgi:hypothetical protein